MMHRDDGTHSAYALVGAHGSIDDKADGKVLCSRGVGASLKGGDYAIVFSAHAFSLSVGDGGRLIALNNADTAEIGKNAIAVIMNAVEGKTRIKAGSNSLVILRFVESLDCQKVRFVVAETGTLGLGMDRTCIFSDGSFSEISTDDIERPIEAVLQSTLPCEPCTCDTVDDGSIGSSTRDLSLEPLKPGQFLVLCDAATGNGIAGANTLVSKAWNEHPQSPDGIFGLLWGVGDPRLANLGFGEDWALVCVDAYVATGPLDDQDHPAAVKFQKGEIVQTGLHREILQRLLATGLDPVRLVGTLDITGDECRAEVGDHGASYAGHDGWAIAGLNGQAEAGDRGLAEAGEFGFAKSGVAGVSIAGAGGTAMSGEGGLAISVGKRYGTATVGSHGLSVGDGRFKIVRAGYGGAALSTSYGAVIHAADHGVAVGWGAIRVGCSGVAVALDDSETVCGGEGCLLIIRSVNEDGTFHYVSGVVGTEGICPNIRYKLVEGALVPAGE